MSESVEVDMIELDAQGRKLQEVLEFWLVSAPGNPTCQNTFDALQTVVGKSGHFGNVFKLPIPELKVGTLDTLVALAEDLAKMDVYVESITRKIAQYFGEVLEDQRDKLKELLLVHREPLSHAVTKFQWDNAKYPIKHSLRSITDSIAKNVTQIDGDMKLKSQSYNGLKANIQNIERKSTGSLVTRNLTEIVKKEDVVQDSEYLVTLIVVIPGSSQKDWFTKYERLSDMVVPRSSSVIFEDNENALVTATVFTKVVDEFKLHCRENKFVVRDFSYNEADVQNGKTELIKLLTEKKKQFTLIVRWLKVNFSETFSSWLHVKALRTYVESVLRFGLPVNFQAMVLAPPRKSQKKLKEVLNLHYAYLETGVTKPSKADMVEIPGINMSMTDYFPYVFFKVGVDMVEQVKV